MNSEESELIGVWSAGAGYYSTFSDDWLIFRADGTGRLVFLTPYHHDSSHFRWRIVSCGVLELIGFHPEMMNDDKEGLDQSRVLMDFPRVEYRVSDAERPPNTGQWMRELCVNIDEWRPNQFGFLTTDYESSEARFKNS
jgi:hypothetical protein